ncbi:hypothetical protein QFC24_004775 [Naganishia onofrii]|uniref:Uncharacterized protein n=1 Tax=Naganishia onofrii TaxID=1851511 RepID=A0ACC2XDT7_9TREE|nr:hypothetical protein QFC24_004775 [Naganishia onofrii]
MSALADLYSLIPPSQGFILGRDLLQVFTTYEERRGAELLQPAERNALQEFAEQNADAEVDGDLLVQLIGQLLQLQTGTSVADDVDEDGDGKGEGKEVDAEMENSDDAVAESRVSASRAVEQHEQQGSGTSSHRQADDTHVAGAAATIPATPVVSHIPRRKQHATPSTSTTSTTSNPTNTPSTVSTSKALATTHSPHQVAEKRSRDVTSPSVPPSSYTTPAGTSTPSHGKQDHKRRGSDGNPSQGHLPIDYPSRPDTQTRFVRSF